ncbi:MAG: hypothetical protein DRJ45_06465 [Thermoprotei archaeon]|nr:MAG: hypothetical protein DRJ45_06465 [Thermoprotei archaeon]
MRAASPWGWPPQTPLFWAPWKWRGARAVINSEAFGPRRGFCAHKKTKEKGELRSKTRTGKL